MRTLLALLFLVAWPAQAATITYLTDHRGVGARYGQWEGQNDANPSTRFYYEPCDPFATHCAASAGNWSGSVDHESHLGEQVVYARGTAFEDELPCDHDACNYSTVFGRITITLTVDEASLFVFTSVVDGVRAPILRGILRPGEVFEVGGTLLAESWPDGYRPTVVRSSSFYFEFALVPVPEPGTAVLVALGLAVTAARRQRGYAAA